ncbi:BMP family lipoprotein [Sulfobacillus thermosulfidooxidans]|uniref:BMP family lipoprotein n=1 Tax=Sulfobacillus thermosulfidooxidans TaxID=28034 RepID=UPI0006B53413|nr:BMP family ABC transporter substrate-binding protein [Sulfobacillus thermosulfidooxidans]
MRKSSALALITTAIFSGGLLAACGASSAASSPSGTTAKAKYKVGLVTDTGGLNDHGFNHLAYLGLMQAKNQLGVTTSVVQSETESDYVPFLTNYAKQGYNLVIAVGFLMAQAVQQVSKEFPHTKFMIIDDEVPGPNVTSSLFETQQCGYLVGELAGLVQKDHALPHINSYNTLGVVGGESIPPVNTYIAGFYAGVHAVDPSAKIILKYTNDFNNPNNGQTYAQSEIAQHADIIFQVAGGSGLGVITAAKQAHVYAIGVDANQNYLAPNTVITSAEKGIQVATFDTIKDGLQGTLKAGVQYYSLSNNGVGMAPPISAIPASIVQQVLQSEKAIRAGKIIPPTTIP